MLFTTGRVCIKLAGRDAGKHCVVVDQAENGFVLIDGQTRRRKVNVLHLEPTSKMVDIAKGADTAAVIAALKTQDIEVEKKGSARTASTKPVKKHAEKKK